MQADYEGEEQAVTAKPKHGKSFKENRKSRAKARNDVPHFVAVVDEITAKHPPAPYLINPLSKAALNSRLGDYVSRHFNWNTFPEDVDIGERVPYATEGANGTMTGYSIVLIYVNIVFSAEVGTAGRGGQLPPVRVQRKRQQLDNIMAFVVPFIHSSNLPSVRVPSSNTASRERVVVDFCCG